MYSRKGIKVVVGSWWHVVEVIYSTQHGYIYSIYLTEDDYAVA